MRPLILPLTIAALLVTPAFSQASDTTKNTIAPPLRMSSEEHPVSAVQITLEQAWLQAENANAVLRRAKAQRAAAEGDVTDARSLLWNNPSVTVERTRRDVPQTGMLSENQREWATGVAQSFEIGGQQSYRRKVAQHSLNALDASIEDTRREIHAEVERNFVLVLSLQDRIVTERQSLKIIEDTAASVKKRVAAGEDSKLDGNLASVEAIRARNQIGVLEEQLLQARTDLATTIQMSGNEFSVVVGSLNDIAPTYTLDVLLMSATNRPLLRALDSLEQAAKNRLSLERAARYPDITVGLTSAREGSVNARERRTSLALSLPLPIFRNNASGIGRASTELTQTQIERDTTQRNTGNAVASLWQKVRSLSARVDALQQNVLPALEENQRLSSKSMQVGEIGLFELLLVNRQVLDGRRDLIDAKTELRLTRIALHQAAGWISN